MGFKDKIFNIHVQDPKVNLKNFHKLSEIINLIKPDLVMHLAAESHVDRSINSPWEFIESNVIGTYNLLEASRSYFNKLNGGKKSNFRFHHISTDEVFGSLDNSGFFSEESSYNPRSPYSSSKASSDHLVNSWYHTYDLPVIITNCSNNYGPYQSPEKLIPLTIIRCFDKKKIPVYGNGKNIRDWIYVEDHINAIFIVLLNGKIGESYCIGSNQEFTNIEIARKICLELDRIKPKKIEYSNLIKFVEDRPGHDFRYSIDPSLIKNQLGWVSKTKFKAALTKTVKWYLENKQSVPRNHFGKHKWFS